MAYVYIYWIIWLFHHGYSRYERLYKECIIKKFEYLNRKNEPKNNRKILSEFLKLKNVFIIKNV